MLRAGNLILAQRLQEASESLSSNELRGKLSDAVGKAHEGTTSYGNYIDHTGDEDSGDCIYQCSGNGESITMKAPYSKGTDSSDSDYTVDTSKAVKVAPRMSYVEQPDEADHYSAMESAKLYTKGPMPICERFVSKKERDSAGSGDFAGKGKSFPILKAADVSAAASSIGRAGSDNYSTDVIKKNIIRIAKAKGWTSELPKAWQDGATDTTESRVDSAAGGLRLVESASTLETIRLTEAKADYEIKLIAPGKGSTAFYPAEVLKRDGPNVFKAGTHVYLNHQTAAEEAQRPEGDVKNLAGVLTTDAVYHESHAKGPGLYGRMKVFADHAQTVEEKAPHVGMSIRASGVAESGKTREGRPVLKELTSAESVDVVTRAGAGGMILTESARGAQQEESDMTVEEKALLSRLVEKDVRREAIELGAKTLDGVALNESAKMYIIETVVDRGVPKEAGALDSKKFVEAVNAEARRFGGAIGAGPRVTGMGAPPPVELTEAQRAAQAAAQKADEAMYRESAAALLGTDDPKIIDRFITGRVN